MLPNLVYTDDVQGAQTDYVIALNREILAGENDRSGA